jgi:GNAT superfamily N-acetyltransferase
MGFELGITEVGPAEYPLIEVLRQTIFDEVGHVSRTTLAEDLEGKRDILALIAHLEGNPVGFKVGHAGDRPGDYYSKAGGVLKEYRRQGLATRMQDWQHRFARARGYRQAYFNTFNHFPEMILFGLRSGFAPVAAERRELGGMSFRFARSLEEPVRPSPAGLVAVDLQGDARLELPCDDLKSLHEAVTLGYRLTGLRHDFEAGATYMILERPAAAAITPRRPAT